MKAEIHPEMRDVIFQDTISTAPALRSSWRSNPRPPSRSNGQEYPLVKVDISSASHPFYTGNQRIVDTTGRVEKFGSKFGASLSKLAKKKKKAARPNHHKGCPNWAACLRHTRRCLTAGGCFHIVRIEVSRGRCSTENSISLAPGGTRFGELESHLQNPPLWAPRPTPVVREHGHSRN